MTKRRRHLGFTLVELMITVAIVAILASIAYPSYRSAVLKGRRAQARTAILELLQQQERYMTQNNRYLFFETDPQGVTTPDKVPFKTFAGDAPEGTPYRLSAGACTTTLDATECVMITAKPTFTDDTEVRELWATSSGAKNCTGTAATTGAPAKVCWP
jgi:type IV pilus assembly protein PilE